MSFKSVLFTLLIMDTDGTLRVITYIDNFGKVITHVFDGDAIKLALLSGLINILKYLVTSDTKHHLTRLKVISEATLVASIMYALAIALISEHYSVAIRYIASIVIGMSGYTVIEKTIKILVIDFYSRITSKSISSKVDKKDK